MKRAVALATLLGLLALVGCAGTKHQSPILVNRGVSEFERDYFIKKESYGISPELKKKFTEGEVAEGMTQEMVRLLWGPPDREFTDENLWEFVTREGNVIASIKFDKEETRSRAIGPERIITAIEGDRRGGLPVGQLPTP